MEDPTRDAFCDARKTLKLLVAGDVLVHPDVWESGVREDGSLCYTHLFTHVKDRIQRCDVALVNQETVLGGSRRGLSGFPRFNSPFEIADAEVEAGFTSVLHANNHAMDQGYDGLCSELDFWHTKHPHISVLGVAQPFYERASWAHACTFEKDGLKVAVLNFTYGTNGITDPADAVALLEPKQVDAAVRQAKLAADIVVACPHWGYDRMSTPDDEQRTWAQRFLELGVDAVVGGHPHVIQPVEVLKRNDGHEMPVFWSIGNFVAAQRDLPCLLGGIATLSCVKDACGARVDSWEMEAVAIHRSKGTDFSVYPLSAYPDELARKNHLGRKDDQVPTRGELVSLARNVLGEGFNTSTCTIGGTLHNR